MRLVACAVPLPNCVFVFVTSAVGVRSILAPSAHVWYNVSVVAGVCDRALSGTGNIFDPPFSVSALLRLLVCTGDIERMLFTIEPCL